MWRNYKNWIKLIKFIRTQRKEGNSKFEILTTGDQIIVYPSDLWMEIDKPVLRIKSLNL